MSAMPASYDTWKLDNGHEVNASARTLEDELRRMAAINAALDEKCKNTLCEGLVQLDHDPTAGDRPWQVWVGDRDRCFAALDEAVEEGAEALRAAAATIDNLACLFA